MAGGVYPPVVIIDEMNTREKRLAQMNRGMEELGLWLGDLTRQGLGQVDAQALERFAAHMVDAKLGSIGRRIRGWKRLLGQENWQEQLLTEMGELFLLVLAFRKAGTLPGDLVHDLLQLAGMPPKKEEVLQGDPVDGIWSVLGIVSGEEDNLRFRRTWLQREKDGSFALLLDFAWGEQPFGQNWQLGRQHKGTLAYYPSAFPQRALVHELEKPGFGELLPTGLRTLEDLGSRYAEALALQPWLHRFPVFLENVLPLRLENGAWLLADENRQALPLTCSPLAGWALLSLSGGHPLGVFGEYDGATLSPLSCLSSGRLIGV